MLHVGVGVSTHRNPKQAGAEAVARALEQAQIETCDFVLLFATVGYDLPTLLKVVREATGRAPLVGSSGEGVLAQGITNESNHAVAVMVWKSDVLQFRPVVAEGLHVDCLQVGRSIAEQLNPVPDNALMLLLFADALSFNFDKFKAGLLHVLNVSKPLPIVGGTSADNWQLKQTYQIVDDKIMSNAVCGAVLSGPAEMAFAVTHGCIPIGHERMITKCQGNMICEVDDKPVMEVLTEYLDSDEIQDFNKVSVNFALGFQAPEQMVEDYDDYVIRFMPGKGEVPGSVLISTEVQPGTKVWMTRRDSDKVFQSLDRMATKVQNQLKDRPPLCVFHIDCAGRGKVLFRDEQRHELLTQLQKRISQTVPWIGLYSFGELGPVASDNFFHNYTAVLGVLYQS
jgi:small ligand-binding sensory domain FIST